ncbi:glycosyl hydrolase family 18 protein [Microbulbifer aggregans]|uniref:glycosyl hydrolase family 18 protein n=1 Tax=Microbulbifer aggregans TaxID=1769779 RepID=UPI001CFC5660|nr:glycosyl hydrolase family 18 protein [Microbulbifer aggregans]
MAVVSSKNWVSRPFFFIFFCLLFSIANEGTAENQPLIVGYYPYWSTFREPSTLAESRVELLTHLIYSSVNVNQDGTLASFDQFADYGQTEAADTHLGKGNLSAIKLLKERNPELKVLFSVGTWLGSSHFSSLFSVPEKRDQFLNSSLNLIQNYGFDGLEIDWRYPVIGGPEGSERSPADLENLLQFAKRFKSACRDCPLFLTAPVVSRQRPKWPFRRLNSFIDAYVPLTSDYTGPWSSETGHASPLYESPNSPAPSINGTISQLMEEGVPPEKLVIRVSASGAGWNRVAPYNQGLNQTAQGPIYTIWDNETSGATGSVPYLNLQVLLQRNQFEPHWDNETKSFYAWQPESGQFISIEEPRSLMEKLHYISRHNLAGIALWDLPSDTTDETSLLTRSHQYFFGLEAFWFGVVDTLRGHWVWLVSLLIGAVASYAFVTLKRAQQAKQQEIHSIEVIQRSAKILPPHLDQLIFLLRHPPATLLPKIPDPDQQVLHRLQIGSAQLQYQLLPIWMVVNNGSPSVNLPSTRLEQDKPVPDRKKQETETAREQKTNACEFQSLIQFTGLVGQQTSLEKMLETLFHFLNQDSRIETLGLYQEDSLVKGEDIGGFNIEVQADKPIHISTDKRQGVVCNPDLADQKLHINFTSPLTSQEEAYFRALSQQLVFARQQLRELTKQPQLLSDIYQIAKRKDQLLFIRGEKGYSGIYCSNEREPCYVFLRLRHIRQYFPDLLHPVHRSYLVNPKQVLSVDKQNKKWTLLVAGHQIPISKSRVNALMKAFPAWF